MALPSMLTYNELDGTEVAQIIQNRIEQFVMTVPHFQRHITLPRVRVTVNVRLELWADQPTPESVPLNDRFDILVERAAETEVIEGESVDSSAPVDGGHPPDRLREMHGLALSEPAQGPRDIGGHMQIADRPVVLDGAEIEGLPGLRISRTGSGVIDGMPSSARATIAKIDSGPAGLRAGAMNRERWHFGGKK